MFYIYHHNDFDGLASAALFAKFLQFDHQTKLEDIFFYPVDYDLRNSWASYDFKKPCAILDFLYHYQADWWFDHHNSTFIDEIAVIEPYKHNSQKYWNTKFNSCPSLIVSHFYRYKRKHSLLLKSEYKDLIYWSDVIDGAKYKSPNDLYNYNNLYITINKTLALCSTIEYYKTIIKTFYFNDLSILLNDAKYIELVGIAKAKEDLAIDTIKKIIHIENKVAYFDQSDYDLPFQRYTAYLLFPEIKYRIGIYKKNGQYSVSVNYNIWSEKKNAINLGGLCKKLGGGGRFNVGAILTDTHNEAIKKSLTLLDWLKMTDVIQLNLEF